MRPWLVQLSPRDDAGAVQTHRYTARMSDPWRVGARDRILELPGLSVEVLERGLGRAGSSAGVGTLSLANTDGGLNELLGLAWEDADVELYGSVAGPALNAGWETDDLSQWAYGSFSGGVTVVTGDPSFPGRSGSYFRAIDDDDGNETFVETPKPVPCDPAAVYELDVWVRQPTGTRPAFLVVTFLNADGQRIRGFEFEGIPPSDAVGWTSIGTDHYHLLAGTVPPAVWTLYKFRFGAVAGGPTIPSAARHLVVGFYPTRASAQSPNPTTFEFGTYRVREISPVLAQHAPEALEDFVLEARMRATGIAQSADGVITLRLTDLSGLLDVPLALPRYAGTGGVEGPPEFEGRPKPFAIGPQFNVPLEGKFIDRAALIAQVHLRRIGGILFDAADPARRGVTDKGVPLTGAGDYPTFAALKAADLSGSAFDGTYVTCLAEGLVRLARTPKGVVCVDFQGDADAAAGGYVETPGAVVQRILDALWDDDAITADAIALAQLDTDFPHSVKLYVDSDGVRVSDWIETAVLSAGGFWWVDELGMLQARVLADEDPVAWLPDHGITRPELIDAWPRINRLVVGYRAPTRVMTEEELAESVRASDLVGGQNLLPANFSAARSVEVAWTGMFGPTTNVFLDQLGAYPGEPISMSAFLRGNGSDTLDLAWEWRDANNAGLPGGGGTGVPAPSTSSQRAARDGNIVPTGAAYLRIYPRNLTGTGTAYVRAMMVNRGSIALPHEPPPSRVTRGEVEFAASSSDYALYESTSTQSVLFGTHTQLGGWLGRKFALFPHSLATTSEIRLDEPGEYLVEWGIRYECEVDAVRVGVALLSACWDKPSGGTFAVAGDVITSATVNRPVAEGRARVVVTAPNHRVAVVMRQYTSASPGAVEVNPNDLSPHWIRITRLRST